MVGIGVDPVGTARRGLDHPVAGVVDRIGVIARASCQRVGMGGIADEAVGQRIAGQRPACAAHGIEEFDRRIGIERVVGIGVDPVGTARCGLDHPVASVVDRIGVIAQTTHQRVGMGRGRDQPVGKLVAAQRDATAACRHGQDFNRLSRPKHPTGCRDHLIKPVARPLDHGICKVVDMIGVVARTPCHQVAG